MCSQKAISSRFECQFEIYAQLTIFLLLQVLSIKGLGSLSFVNSIQVNSVQWNVWFYSARQPKF